MVASFTHDVLIIGHGLAGAVLADRLLRRGLTVHVFDERKDLRASHVAAGIVNPISLRRDVLTWRAHQMLDTSRQHFQELDRRTGRTMWHPIELIKIFPTSNEALQWRRAMNSNAADLLSNKQQPTIDRECIRAPEGHGTVLQCAWVDLNALIEAQRKHLRSENALSEEGVTETDIEEISGGVSVHGRTAPWVVHCKGPYHELPGIVPVKGEVLTVKIPGLRLESILHRQIFLLPIGNEFFKLGSTFVWNDVWTGPTLHAREHLLGKLKEIIPHRIEVIDHQAGVRPAARDRRPLLGIIGEHRAVFNGLGARGTLIAPWCAEHLIEHMFEGKPLDLEVDISRFR